MITNWWNNKRLEVIREENENNYSDKVFWATLNKTLKYNFDRNFKLIKKDITDFNDTDRINIEIANPKKK